MKEWQDITSYSRSDKELKPNTFEIRTGPVRISICSGNIYYPGKWVMNCAALRIDTVLLKASTLVDAQKEALEKAHALAADICDALNELMKA